MKAKNKTKTRKPSAEPKKIAPRRKTQGAKSKVPLTYQRKEEEDFIGAHPEAFDPYVGQWVAMQGPAIIAHGDDLSTVTQEARARGASRPLVFRVLPKRGPNEGYLF